MVNPFCQRCNNCFLIISSTHTYSTAAQIIMQPSPCPNSLTPLDPSKYLNSQRCEQTQFLVAVLANNQETPVIVVQPV